MITHTDAYSSFLFVLFHFRSAPFYTSTLFFNNNGWRRYQIPRPCQTPRPRSMPRALCQVLWAVQGDAPPVYPEPWRVLRKGKTRHPFLYMSCPVIFCFLSMIGRSVSSRRFLDMEEQRVKGSGQKTKKEHWEDRSPFSAFHDSLSLAFFSHSQGGGGEVKGEKCKENLSDRCKKDVFVYTWAKQRALALRRFPCSFFLSNTLTYFFIINIHWPPRWEYLTGLC